MITSFPFRLRNQTNEKSQSPPEDIKRFPLLSLLPKNENEREVFPRGFSIAGIKYLKSGHLNFKERNLV